MAGAGCAGRVECRKYGGWGSDGWVPSADGLGTGSFMKAEVLYPCKLFPQQNPGFDQCRVPGNGLWWKLFGQRPLGQAFQDG